MLNFTKKKQIPILILIVALSIIFIMSKINNDKNRNAHIQNINNKEDELGYNNKEEEFSNEDFESESPTEIMVHIKGAVSNPGIIRTKNESRIVDIIELAGGLLDEADTERINLAQKIEDEDLIHIPFIGEVNEEEHSDIVVDSKINKTSSNSDTELVNINKADKEELKKLNGVGDSTAEKIIQYREENKFETIEDIMNVSGIGEKKFEAIKDSIVVR